MNGMGGWDSSRFSDTSNLTSQDMEVLMFESTDLINQLKHILLRFDPAYDILEKIAQKPVAFRRIDGDSWQKIEDDLKVDIPMETKIEKIISELIDIRKFTSCKDEKDWVIKVADYVSKEEGEDILDNLKQIVESNKGDGEYIWSNHLGTMLKV